MRWSKSNACHFLSTPHDLTSALSGDLLRLGPLLSIGLSAPKRYARVRSSRACWRSAALAPVLVARARKPIGATDRQRRRATDRFVPTSSLNVEKIRRKYATHGPSRADERAGYCGRADERPSLPEHDSRYWASSAVPAALPAVPDRSASGSSPNEPDSRSNGSESRARNVAGTTFETP